MTFWLIAAALTAAALAAVLHPLLGRRAPAPAPDRQTLVFRDQLGEVGRDQARGLIGAAEAEAARAEIGRRLIGAAAHAAAEAPSGGGRRPRLLAATLGVAIPLAALALYAGLGSPGLTSQPHGARGRAAMEAHAAAIAEVESLAARAEATGTDPALWIELGQRAMALGMAERAAAAFERAAGLTDGDPLVTAAWGEALVEASGGMVTEEARAAFERTLAGRPQDPRARYYLALARAQAGDDEGALAGWQALAAASPADAPWQPAVRERIAEAAGRLGLDSAAAVPAPAPGPSAADIEGAAAMTPDEQAAMIEGMVEQLAARLDAAPDDVEGWLRLARAYEVLGRPAERLAAVRRAAEVAPGHPGALAALGEALVEAAPPEGPLGAELVAVMERLAAADPSSLSAMWFLGVHAVEEGRPADARRLWGTLLEHLAPGSPEHDAVRSRLDALPAG